MITIPGKYTTASIFNDNVEEEAIAQITRTVNHPAFTNHIAIMPDVHAGAGSVIGFTMKLGEAVIPNIVGVDIGCGMLATKFHDVIEADFEELDKKIRNKVPFGTNVRPRSDDYSLKAGAAFFAQVQTELDALWMKLREVYGNEIPGPERVDEAWYRDKCSEIGMNFNRAQASLGSLGGGNHFIEFGTSKTPNPDAQSQDKEIENTWLVIHSGSRQFGKAICDYHQGIAKSLQEQATKGDYQQQIEQIKKTTPQRYWQEKITELRRSLGIISGLDTKGLEMLTGKAMVNYLYDMAFAQQYAAYNRACILLEVLDCLKRKRPQRPRLLGPDGQTPHIIESISTVHNYINLNDLIIRKGAVAAYSGTKVVIPFNMKDGTWICTGQSNPAWNYSAPHGAGRLMSRSKAKKILKQEDAEKEMEGIYTSCIPLDEAPAAYKSASDIKEAIGSTAAVVEQIRPVMNLKAK